MDENLKMVLDELKKLEKEQLEEDDRVCYVCGESGDFGGGWTTVHSDDEHAEAHQECQEKMQSKYEHDN